MADVPVFLCDEMLVGLGRWLRIAGYDTAIAEHRCRIRGQTVHVVGVLASKGIVKVRAPRESAGA